MSSYPPPPPGGPYPPYDRDAWRAQRRAAKEQARAMRAQVREQMRLQRDQMRLQRRALRRRSVLGPLMLLAIGVTFLLAELGRISWGQTLEWYSRWWPAVLIVAGLVLLAEWALDQQHPNTQGQTRSLGGGVVLLLIVLALTGISARGVEYGMDWEQRAFGDSSYRLNHLFGERHDAESTTSSPIAAGSSLVIRNPHGDVTVSSGSDDGEVHVSEHTQSYAWKDSEARAKAGRMQPVFSGQGKDLTLDVAPVEGGRADLTIELPRSIAVSVQADGGDVRVSDMAAAVAVSARHGDVEITAVHGSVELHIHDDDANLTLRSINGPVLIDGRGGDTEVADVHGDVTMQGDFFGSTHLQHINGGVRFETSRTRFSTARLDEDFTVNRESLDATALAGPVLLKTVDKNIRLDRTDGLVDVVDRNGSVAVTHALPLAAVSIQNTHGSIDLGLPDSAGFTVNARTRNGDMENDFGLTAQGSAGEHTLRGNVAGGGPAVTLTTTDGDITLRRSTVDPLPPAPPTPPITLAPPAAPKAPKAPAPPRPPVGRTF
jgi:DUF4097 and DUF4098 domain-containing protein YvlB